MSKIRFRNKKRPYFYDHNPILDKPIKYAEIVVHQTLNVRGVPITNDNVYDVDAFHIHDKDYYHEPFRDPDYNIRNLMRKYKTYKEL